MSKKPDPKPPKGTFDQRLAELRHRHGRMTAPPKRKQQSIPWRVSGELIATLVTASFLGYMIDGYFGSQPIGIVIGLILGMITGIRNVIRITEESMNAKDDSR